MWAKDILELVKSQIHDKELVASTIKQRGFDSTMNAQIVYKMYNFMCTR